MRQSGADGTTSRARAMTRVCLCGVLLTVAFAFGGCSSKPKPGRYTVEVTPTSAVGNQKLVVDFFGTAEDGGWSTARVKQHFAGGQFELQRQELHPVTLTWQAGDTNPRQLAATDEAWNTWIEDGAWYLVIAADAQVPSATGGTQHPGPLVLPLDKRRWKTKLIKVELGSSGLVLKSRMEPPPE